MRISWLLITAMLLFGCEQVPQSTFERTVDVFLRDSMLAHANAQLPGHTPVWHENGISCDTVLSGCFISSQHYLRAEKGEYFSDVCLLRFHVLAVDSGRFPEKELRFFRVMHHRKGVKDKRLILNKYLRFYLEKAGSKYVIRNIERIDPAPFFGKSRDQITDVIGTPVRIHDGYLAPGKIRPVKKADQTLYYQYKTGELFLYMEEDACTGIFFKPEAVEY